MFWQCQKKVVMFWLENGVPTETRWELNKCKGKATGFFDKWQTWFNPFKTVCRYNSRPWYFRSSNGDYGGGEEGEDLLYAGVVILELIWDG